MQSTLTLTLANTSLTSPQPVLYVGQAATLAVTLTNDTGAALTLQAGSTPSTLDYYLPAALALQPSVADLCTGLTVPGWQAAPNPDAPASALRLTYTSQEGTSPTWGAGAALTLTLASLKSSQTTPATSALSVVPTNVSGANVPDQVFMPLTLETAPATGPVSLAGLLEVSLTGADLTNAGLLYVSTDPQNELLNTLQLNIKNVRQDGQGNPLPLYSGTTPWANLSPAPTPQISAWFVYGTDSGSLAPDTPAAAGLPAPAGSAWNIKLAIANDQAPSGWVPSGPVAATTANPSAGGSPPQWLLQAATGNLLLLGGGDEANLTVNFNNIISATPTGHTQLYLAFTNFWQDETTAYEPYFLALDIDKLTAPASTILSFYAPQMNAQMMLSLNQPGQQIAFNWSVAGVTRIELAVDVIGVDVYSASYASNSGTSNGVLYDSYSFPLLSSPSGPVPYDSGPQTLTFTLTAYDAEGKVGSSQCSIKLDNQLYVDQDNQIYPTVQVGKLIWMAQNLSYAADGSDCYNADASNIALYGRLYYAATAGQNAAAGWRLPSSADFTSLLDAVYGAPPRNVTSCSALLVGGSSGFEGQLGGLVNYYSQDDFYELGSSGNYWSSTAVDANNQICLTLYTDGYPAYLVIPSATVAMGYSVRYVRDVSQPEVVQLGKRV